MSSVEIREGSNIQLPSQYLNTSTGVSSTSLSSINYVPIDYIKGELINFDNQELLSNVNLNFCELMNVDTGEVFNSNQPKKRVKKPHRISVYKSLVFRYYTESNRMFISGSLHSLHNDGVHNFNDFNLDAFRRVLKALNNVFNISPNQINITQIEWGVNVSPTIESNTIINHSLFHKSQRFEVKIDNVKGKYHQAEHKKYYILKLYNKGLQFGLEKNLLRFERKQLDYLKYCKQKNIGQTLQDLIDSGFKGLKETLLMNWNEILFYDPQIIDNSNKIIKYRDPLFWVALRRDKSGTTVTNHRNKLRRFNRTLGGNIQEITSDIIENKIKALNNDVLQDSYFSYIPKTTTSSSQPIKYCLLTGVNISMQRVDSFLLSHTGLKYYLQNNIQEFERIKKEYLTVNWIASDTQIQIKEIAHNIRTKYSQLNNKKREDYIRGCNQYSIFNNVLNKIIVTHYGI